MPKVSIIIPVYNRGELLKATLQSISNQTFEAWECIIVDDKSEEDIKSVVQPFLKDHRFCFLTNTNKKGAPGARNTGLASSKGEFIYFFDADNLMKPSAIEELYNGINASNTDVYTCFANVLNDQGEKISSFKWVNEGDIFEKLLSSKTYVDYNNAIIRKSCIDKLEKTDENCPSYQEWDTHIRLSQFSKYGTTEQFLIDYYQRKQNTISSDKKRSSKGYFYILEKHRSTFIKYPKVYKEQGWTLTKMIHETNDQEFIRDYSARIKALIPGFSIYLAQQKLKNLLKIKS